MCSVGARRPDFARGDGDPNGCSELCAEVCARHHDPHRGRAYPHAVLGAVARSILSTPFHCGTRFDVCHATAATPASVFAASELAQRYCASPHAVPTRSCCVQVIPACDVQVFMLNIDAVMDYDTLEDVMECGYSRIPVYEGERKNIVGIVFAKVRRAFSRVSSAR
jgi:hypothetical protein